MSAELIVECTELFSQVHTQIDSALNTFNSKIFDNLISDFSKLEKELTAISSNLNKSILEQEKSVSIMKETIEKMKLAP